MPVTEFAHLHLSPSIPSSPLPATLLATLREAMVLQSAWHAAHFPHLPSSAAERAALWFAQVEDPSWLLTTARWETVPAHLEWVRSEDNVRIMSDAVSSGVIEGGDTVLLHVEGDIFENGGALMQSEVISMGRMFVKKGERGTFEAKFEEVKGILEGYAGTQLVRYGWREDVEEGAEEDELVLVCGWESVEKHMEFAETPEFARYSEIGELVARVELRHYKPMSLE
ncbi:hypothetical protein VTI74DRAFT_5675 [Chaetomium olivicolor]